MWLGKEFGVQKHWVKSLSLSFRSGFYYPGIPAGLSGSQKKQRFVLWCLWFFTTCDRLAIYTTATTESHLKPEGSLYWRDPFMSTAQKARWQCRSIVETSKYRSLKANVKDFLLFQIYFYFHKFSGMEEAALKGSSQTTRFIWKPMKYSADPRVPDTPCKQLILTSQTVTWQPLRWCS